jgi:hypothetical protein
MRDVSDRGVIVMSSTEPRPDTWPAASRESLEEQARRKGAKPIKSIHDLARDGIWESDEELDAFLKDYRARRRAELS